MHNAYWKNTKAEMYILSNDKRKRQRTNIRYEGFKLSRFADNIISYTEKPKDSTENLLDISEFSKPSG